uniref:Uncharacterized protein n=1 Tax=Arundo donax TaxID=35708 RepID=A0A0A8ZYQ6_ARUDO
MCKSSTSVTGWPGSSWWAPTSGASSPTPAAPSSTSPSSDCPSSSSRPPQSPLQLDLHLRPADTTSMPRRRPGSQEASFRVQNLCTSAAQFCPNLCMTMVHHPWNVILPP